MYFPKRRLRWYHRLIKGIASTTWGARLFSFLLHRLDRRVYTWTNGRATLASWLSDLTIVMITTTGAKSGLPRTIPIIAIPHPEHETTFVLIASNWGQKKYPAWYYNLKSNPQAACEYAGESYAYIAHEAERAEYQQLWEHAVSFYAGYGQYRQRVTERHIPIMVMTATK